MKSAVVKNFPIRWPGLLMVLFMCVTLVSCELFCDDKEEEEPPLDEIPAEGLVGKYLFDGNANDLTSFQNHGVVKGGAVLTAGHDGKANSAYSFNGKDQMITIPSKVQTNFDTYQDFTISLWARPDSEQNDTEAPLNDILRKWAGDAQGYPFCVTFYNRTAPSLTNSQFSFVRYNGNACLNSPQLYSYAYDYQEYVHVVAMKEGGRLKLYIDGQLESSQDDLATCTTANNAPITIGARANLVRFFTGDIDDVLFYNRALNDDEVKVLYRN